MKCNETLSKWCKNKHGASKIMDTLETYQTAMCHQSRRLMANSVSVHQRQSQGKGQGPYHFCNFASEPLNSQNLQNNLQPCVLLYLQIEPK
jgi:hypothetical protein